MSIKKTVEFTLKSDHLEAFLTFMREALKANKGFEGFEGLEMLVDRENLIVQLVVGWAKEGDAQKYFAFRRETGFVDNFRHMLEGPPETRSFDLDSRY